MKATWNNTVIAESEKTVKLEGNHYFPSNSIKSEYFIASPSNSTCPWKGVASYYTIEVDGTTNKDAAWYYADPKADADAIKGHVAFWKGVRIEE